MVTVVNFASKLSSIILEQNSEDQANEWRLLGQEQDGSLLFSWIQTNSKELDTAKTKIGVYNNEKNSLTTIHSFDGTVNCIQASIDASISYLAYVLKNATLVENENKFVYQTFLLEIDTKEVHDLKLEKCRQIFVQFLYPKHSVLAEKPPIKFLILLHQESILQYQIKLNNKDQVNSHEESISFNVDTLARKFSWAQWDPVQQTLFYIHFRKHRKGLVEGDDESPTNDFQKIQPTLTGLQFHDNGLPHESVLNIPLNLPHVSPISGSCGIYEDDTVPLRVHDCSLDLIVLVHPSGFVCVCHHYLYQPVQNTSDTLDVNDNDNSFVHFAYSVTVLHQSCVLHCIVPTLPWAKAKKIRPLFKYHDEHLLVFIPEVCTHLLDIGAMHESCCHVTLEPLLPLLRSDEIFLSALATIGNDYVINLVTLEMIKLTIPTSMLEQTFKSETALDNKISILHYLILHHKNANEIVSELITWQAEKPLMIGLTQILREFLIGKSYASVNKALSSNKGEADNLVRLLPITTQHLGADVEVKIGGRHICLSQDVLWNASMMLLSPQQRIVPYRTDIWVKLWDQLGRLSKGKQRFRPNQVMEKLLVSLVCYKPEALSRSSTPMSPSAGSLATSTTILNDFLAANSGRKGQFESLPFYEIESCTASKQEHVISVNRRELSIYLLKQSADEKMSRLHWQVQTPIHVDSVVSRYISAQLEQSRYLCQLLCKAATYDARRELDKGFVYIELLREEKRFILFTILERYYMTVESIAFPLPQGFSSFFAFLAYKTLNFDMFLQYIQRNVLELQVDVMKIIMADIDNSKAGVENKLKLLTSLPRSRAKRLLNQWHHPISLMWRAREHSFNILAGIGSGNSRLQSAQKQKSFRSLSSKVHLEPLDTFLDLLTAKASLTELDFGLLIEATESSNEEFIG